MNDELFESYLSRSLDRDLTAQEFAELEQHLIGSPEARARYLEYVDLHTVLDLDLQQATSPVALGTSSIVDIDRIIRRQKRRSRRVAMISAAAILIIGLLIMQVFLVKEKRDSLTFQTSPGTQFTVTHSTASEAPAGMVMENGSRLQLSQGAVELTFKSGVKSIVMAPADMTLHDDDTLFLNKGTAWFQVPKGAEGFTVKTRELNIVDLGTEFGVFSHLDEHDEVHVIKGKVEVSTLRLRKETATLAAGQARRIDPIGRLTTIKTKSSRFLTSLPNSLPYLHWSFDGNNPFQPKGSIPEIKTITTRPIQSDSRPAAERLTPGKNGQALSFNGKGDHLKTNWMGILGNEPRSVACWIKIHPDNPNGWAPIVEWGKMSQNNYWRFRISKDEKDRNRAILRLGLGNSWFDGQTNLADGKWHHVAVVDSGNLNEAGEPDIKFFVDGEEEPAIHQKNSKIVEKRETVEGLPMIVGIHNDPYTGPHYARFNGMIDEIFIFRATLSPTYVQRIMKTHQP